MAAARIRKAREPRVLSLRAVPAALGRMPYPAAGGEPLGWGRLPGFAGNFSPRWVRARQGLAQKR